MMLRDPRIQQPLSKRRLVTAQLPTRIVPEDDNDDAQMEAARLLHSLIAWDNPVEVYQNLLAATWYGCSGGGLKWETYEKKGQPVRYRVTDLEPIHSDSIMFTVDGEPVIRVGPAYRGPRDLVLKGQSEDGEREGDTVVSFPQFKVDGGGNIIGTWGDFSVRLAEQDEILIGPDSRVRRLTDEEARWLFVKHTHNIEAPDYFEDLMFSSKLYAGMGLRDDCWYPWIASHEVERLFIYFCERYAIPIVIGTYPKGNDEARIAVETALANYRSGDGFLTFGVDPADPQASAFGLDIKDPSGKGGIDAFKWYLSDYTGKQFRMLINGALATSETMAVGLNSNIAEIHQQTEIQYVTYDAVALSATMTRQVVSRLQLANNIMPDVRFRFEFVLPSNEESDRLDAVLKATQAGAGPMIRMSEVVELTGCTPAKPGDVTLVDMNAGIGLGGQNQGFPTPFDQSAEGRMSKQARNDKLKAGV